MAKNTVTVYSGCCGAAMQVPAYVFSELAPPESLYLQDCPSCGCSVQVNG